MKKALVFLIIVFMLINVCLATGSSRVKKADLYFDNIGVIINNEQVTLRDSNGKYTEPFIYEDSVYLPLRAIGELFNYNVDWNEGDVRSVILGEKQFEDSVKLSLKCCSQKITYFTDGRLEFSDNDSALSNNGRETDFVRTYLDKKATVHLDELIKDFHEKTNLNTLNVSVSENINMYLYLNDSEYIFSYPDNSADVEPLINLISKLYELTGRKLPWEYENSLRSFSDYSSTPPAVE